MHQVFINNPDLLEFCQVTGIFDRIQNLLQADTDESKELVRQLILDTEFPEKLAISQGLIEEVSIDYDTNWDISKTIIVGNGDVQNYDHGLELAKQSGVDGLMIGRGIFKDPWAFLPREEAVLLDTKLNRVLMLREHITQWVETWEDQKNFPSLKKFVKMYINNFEKAGELRGEFMEMTTAVEMLGKCDEVLEEVWLS
jgi:hypothetical protein